MPSRKYLWGDRQRNVAPVNENIRHQKMMVIDSSGKQRGVMSRSDAIALAQEEGLDLVVVSEKEDKIIARITDYSKLAYNKQKKERKSRRKAQQTLKEVQYRFSTDVGDRQTKNRHAIKFLSQGHRVQIEMALKGRESQHMELAEKKFDEIVNGLSLFYSKCEKSRQGRKFIAILTPKK